jgi:hypothetical protein
MNESVLPFVTEEDNEVTVGDVAIGSSGDPLQHVSHEDPDHDPFVDYPVVSDDDSDSVDDDDTESGDA